MSLHQHTHTTLASRRLRCRSFDLVRDVIYSTSDVLDKRGDVSRTPNRKSLVPMRNGSPVCVFVTHTGLVVYPGLLVSTWTNE